MSDKLSSSASEEGQCQALPQDLGQVSPKASGCWQTLAFIFAPHADPEGSFFCSCSQPCRSALKKSRVGTCPLIFFPTQAGEGLGSAGQR